MAPSKLQLSLMDLPLWKSSNTADRSLVPYAVVKPLGSLMTRDFYSVKSQFRNVNIGVLLNHTNHNKKYSK